MRNLYPLWHHILIKNIPSRDYNWYKIYLVHVDCPVLSLKFVLSFKVAQLDMHMKEHRSELSAKVISLEGALKTARADVSQREKRVRGCYKHTILTLISDLNTAYRETCFLRTCLTAEYIYIYICLIQTLLTAKPVLCEHHLQPDLSYHNITYSQTSLIQIPLTAKPVLS